MKPIHIHSLRLALSLALLAGGITAANATWNYQVTVPTVGSGVLSFDDADVTDNLNGTYTSPLTAFSFAFEGWIFTLADGSDSDLAWFQDPELEFIGIQYLGTHGTDQIEFTPGFGFGDMGTFFANLGTPGEIQIALTDTDFTVASVPAPGTLACLLVGIGLSRLGRWGRS